mmetsp:Transcript_5785/g.13886  ORF Transcript_5785/g.13886 Transcript_5785/m.13886 type:complete len:101 (+) Transcript_5785:374-676(+)
MNQSAPLVAQFTCVDACHKRTMIIRYKNASAKDGLDSFPSSIILFLSAMNPWNSHYLLLLTPIIQKLLAAEKIPHDAKSSVFRFQRKNYALQECPIVQSL